MTYVIGNDAPEGSYATKERVYEASSYAGYKFEITGYAVNKVSAAVRVKNIGIAPLYHNAYVTVNGVRSDKSLKGLLPGEEATYTITGLEIGDSESPEVTITSDKILEGTTIPYKAKLDGSAEVIEGLASEEGTTAIAGLLDENGTTGIAGKYILNSGSIGNVRASKMTDLKGRNVPGKAAKGAYYPILKR